MYYHFGPFELLWYLMANHCFQLLYIMQNARPGMAIDSDKETSYVVTTSNAMQSAYGCLTMLATCLPLHKHISSIIILAP